MHLPHGWLRLVPDGHLALIVILVQQLFTGIAMMHLGMLFGLLEVALPSLSEAKRA
jgi:hypothetical protein